MSKTVTLSMAVRQILANYPFMDEFLQEECVNYSALARKITPELKQRLAKKSVVHEAVVMSIIRYAKSLEKPKLGKQVQDIISKSTLSVKTDVMYVNVAKNDKNFKVIEQCSQKIRQHEGESFFQIQGVSEILVIVDQHNYEMLSKNIPKDEMTLQFEDASIIILHSPPEAAGPGMISYVTGPIAKQGLSIEMLTMTRDTIFIVDGKETTKLFDILKGLIDECRKSS